MEKYPLPADVSDVDEKVDGKIPWEGVGVRVNGLLAARFRPTTGGWWPSS